MESRSVGVLECRLGDCTAEALRPRSREFLIKRFSELCELWASAVNTSSQKPGITRKAGKQTGEWTVGVIARWSAVL